MYFPGAWEQAYRFWYPSFPEAATGKAQREIVATAISFLYICAIPLAVIGQFAGPLVLKIMQVPPDTWDLANSYIRIIFIGTLGNMGYNMNAGILRGVGDSRASLLFLLVSCAVNIALDLLFVAGAGHGCGGSGAGNNARHVLLLAVQCGLYTKAVSGAGLYPASQTAE